MKVSKEKSAENRSALLSAASRLFRLHGVDGVGVNEIAKAAGLTQGALYAHFGSKEALVAEAFSYGFDGKVAEVTAWAAGREPPFEEYLAGLLSTSMRDSIDTGCPMAASFSEVARQGAPVSNSFVSAFTQQVDLLEKSLDSSIKAPLRRRIALAAAASEIGAVAVSRAMTKADPGLADEVLGSVFEALGVVHSEAKRTAR
ncbi:TetR/AcrR family transcriptional regulator [Agrobacterium tumefaciens]|uniref:TetR/AcrR family transcriptional regulator n=1 Tax=Agrobacterium tumefaciens TaxID=358 RepID=UPI0015737334|nr:TetR/AcrR family transcriptional regulator [Agrobacterium tumefaciens]